MEQFDTRLTRVEQQLPQLVTRDLLAEVLQNFNNRFDVIESRFDAIEKRFDAIESRIDTIEKRLDASENRSDAFENRFDAIDDRLSAITTRLEGLADAQHATNKRLDDFIREQRDNNRANGEAWERVDQRTAQIEETNDYVFRKLESIEIALENRGITLN